MRSLQIKKKTKQKPGGLHNKTAMGLPEMQLVTNKLMRPNLARKLQWLYIVVKYSKQFSQILLYKLIPTHSKWTTFFEISLEFV